MLAHPLLKVGELCLQAVGILAEFWMIQIQEHVVKRTSQVSEGLPDILVGIPPGSSTIISCRMRPLVNEI